MSTARILSLGLIVASLAFAQSFPFQLQIVEGTSVVTVQNSSTITIASGGQPQSIEVRATYTGNGVAHIDQQPTILGSAAFTAQFTDTLPVTLGPGQLLTIHVQFTPVSAAPVTAQLSLPYAEEATTSSSGSITLALQGVTSSFVLSYILPEDQNVVPISPGGSIPLPDTLVGATSTASFNLTNAGSGSGVIQSITIEGSAFRLQGLPLLPITVPSAGTLSIGVVYKPTAAGQNTGKINVTLSGGEILTVNLTGAGVAPNLVYEVIGNGGTTPVRPGETLHVTDVDVGQSSSTVVKISNTGTAAVSLTALSAVGTAFQITDGPPVLPRTLDANASIVFTIVFTPTRTGTQTGTLIVNSDVFALSGVGLGSQLSFSYTSGGTVIPITTSNPSVIFSPVRVTESAQVTLDIKNAGTSPATILNIGLGQTGGPFSVSGLPALPTTLAANTTLYLVITFQPTVLGFANGTLVVDAVSIPLVGSGTQPPALPSYTLSGPSGNVSPMTQPGIGLKLSNPYPVAITGTLTMGVASGTLPADPAVQFATGGRTVAFRIPANSTDAVFGTQGTQLGLQTGTVASTITVTPSFATEAGGVDLTPATPTALQFSVGTGAPALISVQIADATAASFTVVITGYSTTRTLTSATVDFTTASGFRMPTSKFTIDLRSVANSWFQSTASQAFGGQFRLSIPFAFQLPADQSVLDGIASASMTVSNESGTSTALQLSSLR